MHIITSLPIDSEIPDNDILAHTRKRIKQAEIIDIPKFPFMMFDSLLSIGDKLEKLENQIDKTYYMFVSTMAKQKADRSESKESFVKTMEECENDLALKLKTFKWIYETGTIESIFDILECKVRKEESVLDERIKGLKELTDEQRKIKSEKLKKKRVKTQPKEEKKEKGKTGTKEKSKDKQVSADSSKDTNSSFVSDNSTTNSVCTQSTAKQSNNQSDETESHLPPLMTQEMQERHKKILEKSLEEMNVKNIPENSKHEISQNKFICNEGESFRDLEIYAEAHEMIRQHYFIANEKQKVESILKEIPEACIETLQLHLKTKNERLYSVFALEKNTDEIIDKLSIHFEYKETITKEEYDDKIDRMNKLCSIIAVTNNNLDLYLSTNYSEVLKVLLHVKFFRVYIESILHYGIGNIKFFVIENKIADWRKILGEWRFSRRLCKDLKFGDIFPHTFVGKNEEEYTV